MKPALMSAKGKLLSIDPAMNGYSVEILNVDGRHMNCFIHSECLSKFSHNFGQLKPNRDVKIKFCKDYNIYGSEIFNIEGISPTKKESK